MSNGSQSGFDFPTRKWITWGLIAILALVALIAVIIILDDGNTTPEIPEGTDQMEWSIVLTDQTGVEVTLKGDEPLGFPTETWEDDVNLSREVQGTFEWDVGLKLPTAVVDINEAGDCDVLNTELIAWGQAVGQALGDARKLQARAFTQHAINTMRDQGCEFDLSQFTDL